MSTSEQHRHEFFEFLRDRWGPARAGQLMELLPPAGTQELATKADLRAEIATLRAEVHREFARQTRTYVLTVTGMWVSGVGLALTAARFA